MGKASKRKWQKRVLTEKITETQKASRWRNISFSIVVIIAVILSFGLFGWYMNLKNKNLNGDENMYALIETNHGNIKIELLREDAPRTVDNFVRLAESGFYDGVLFHRVISDFVIQAGQNPERPEQPIVEEDINGLKNLRGTLSMAKQSDPATGKPKTEFDTQFFINLSDNSSLDGPSNRFYPFAKVVDGMDVADKIAQVPTDEAGVPLTDAVIKSVTIVR